MPFLLILLLLATSACTSPAPATAGAQSSRPSTAAAAATGTTDTAARSTARVRPRPLSPLADSLSHMLVFVPRERSWLTAAARGKRMLVDIGRVDAEVRKDPARLAAYKEAVAALSPLRPGERLRLRGRWGSSDVTIASFDVWNGRIVALLQGDPLVDSLARLVEQLPASAIRLTTSDSLALADSSVAPATACERTLDPELVKRVDVVRDSLQTIMRSRVAPERVANVVFASSRAAGCYGAWRAALAVSVRSKALDWVEERVVMLDSAGAVTPVRVSDLRFRTHDLLMALDADGDGVDDVATRGLRERAGGISILRFDPASRRFARLTSGFAWEQ
jgi:hypothetical protein